MRLFEFETDLNELVCYEQEDSGGSELPTQAVLLGQQLLLQELLLVSEPLLSSSSKQQLRANLELKLSRCSHQFFIATFTVMKEMPFLPDGIYSRQLGALEKVCHCYSVN